jgi:hypothetical protein
MNRECFEWDHEKDIENRLKHSVSFKEAQYAFDDPLRIIAPDKTHSSSEARYYYIGKVNDGIMTVRFINRGNRIRIIGAGYWRKGKKVYEEKNQIHR